MLYGTIFSFFSVATIIKAIARELPEREKQGKRERSFQRAWYDSFSWLEYFENADACFCYARFVATKLQKYPLSNSEASVTFFVM